MTDEKPTASGNRWEPVEGPSADQPTYQSTDQSTETWVATPEPVRGGAWLSRTRTAVGGVAAVLLAGGLGGFAIAQASGDSEGPEGADQRQGVPTGFDHEGNGDFDRGPGPGGPGLGQDQQDEQDPHGDSDDGTDSSNT